MKKEEKMFESQDDGKHDIPNVNLRRMFPKWLGHEDIID